MVQHAKYAREIQLDINGHGCLYERSRSQPFITEYSSDNTCIKVNSQLKSIDIMNFGWDIGKVLGKKHIHTTTFINNIFPPLPLRDLKISTNEHKMSHTESTCRIELDAKIV